MNKDTNTGKSCRNAGFLFFCLLFCFGLSSSRLTAKISERYLSKPNEWYSGPDAKRIAENILTWQDPYGSWPKNIDTAAKPYKGDPKELKGTFDNYATTGEMRFLAKVYKATGGERCRDAFIKAFDLILKAQYPTGGWPQYYPLSRFYHRHITFNDNAMVLVMRLLDDVNRSAEFDFVDADRRAAAKTAFDKGIECILKCQIKVNGKLTVWCAQHDEVDLSPRPARSYELASLSGMESEKILRLLMDLDTPSPEVVKAVIAGVQWYESSKVEGIRVDFVQGKVAAVHDPDAKPMWARFYEIETNRPFFCNRDGIPVYDFNQIDQERLRGYAWYGDWGQAVFKDYEKWKNKWAHLLVPPDSKILMIIGDSTVCDYPLDQVRRGWGQFIQEYFTDKIQVINHARSGRSTKTFIQEGLWEQALATKPAYVLIQFGHNDSHAPDKPESTDAQTDYQDNLRRYIKESRSAGAVPVLVTPMYRRKFDEQGQLKDNLQPYADAMKNVGAELNVPVVDLHTASGQLYLKLGPAACEEFANKPGDQTHFNEKGARAMAELVMQQLPDAEPSLKAYLKNSSK